MASLSNINGKFAVDSTGAIQFSGSAGTSGYILKSNGNAAPTWVAASTVIGGPYLPLAGGILTGATSTASGISFTVGGALTGTTAGFSGSITASGNSNSFGNTTIAALSASTGTFSASVTAAGNSNSFGNSTFTGTVQATQITTTNGLNYLKRNTDASLQLRSENTRSGLFITKPATDTVMGSALVLADESYRLGTSNYYHMYMLQNGNTYFNQNVGIGTASPQRPLHVNGTEGVARFTSTASGNNGFEVGIGTASQAFLWQTENSYMHFATNGVERMRIDSSGNLGVGGSPVLKLEVQGTASSPTPFGSAAVNGVVRIASGGTNPMLDIGSNSAAPYEMWLQAHVPANTYGTPISLQPLGGNVGIGTTAPANKLDVKISTSNRTTLEPVMSVSAEGSGPYTGFGPKISFSSNIYYGASTGNPAGIIETAYIGAVMGVTYATNSDLVFATRDGATSVTEKMRISGSGNLLVGKSSANYTLVGAELRANGQCVFTASGDNPLDLNRLTNDGSVANFRKANTVVGSISVTGSATAYNTSSDYRLKEDLQDFAGLDMVSKIPVYDFKWKTNESRSYGVMAHELQEVLPDAVTGDKDAEEMQDVDYSKIVPLLVKSIQELKAEIEILKNK